ncbi:MAG: hypothetical protein U9R74_18630 [Pseudomonadota bacterium]|nr:hypothetical protein [Pseudomonadota bacterium]
MGLRHAPADQADRPGRPGRQYAPHPLPAEDLGNTATNHHLETDRLDLGLQTLRPGFVELLAA